MSGSDALFNGALRDRLLDGPGERLHQPLVAAGCVDFGNAGVDLGGEVIGDAERDVLGHIRNGSTIDIDIKSGIVLGMTTTAAEATETATVNPLSNAVADMLRNAVERFGSVDAAAEALMALMQADSAR